MDKGRVGEESKGKETDRCPLTDTCNGIEGSVVLDEAKLSF
jgi:hypothetical protein